MARGHERLTPCRSPFREINDGAFVSGDCSCGTGFDGEYQRRFVFFLRSLGKNFSYYKVKVRLDIFIFPNLFEGKVHDQK